MRKHIIWIAAVAACLCGCAKSPSAGKNDAAKRYFDAWIASNKESSWKQTELGVWIIEDTPGTGEAMGEYNDSLYLRINYTYTDLKGNVQGTTHASMSQQLGNYDENSYYGPQVFFSGALYAGMRDMMKDMRVGGKRKAVIPGWLVTYDYHDTAEEYLSSETGDAGIYELEVVDRIENIFKWETDSIETYISRNFPSAGTPKTLSDTTGFYYICSTPGKGKEAVKDTTVYINYIGRLLNGTVFDTNIRDTAMRHGIFSSSRDYSPVSIQAKAEYSNTTMGSGESSIIKGFSRTISKMRPYEKGSGIFFSPLGYSYSGSGNSIPAFSPLRFDIELVADPSK